LYPDREESDKSNTTLLLATTFSDGLIGDIWCVADGALVIPTTSGGVLVESIKVSHNLMLSLSTL